jgi:fused signal recognition particle receptor
MAREWSDLLVLRDGTRAQEEETEEQTERRRGLFRRLRASLRATRESFGGSLDGADLEALEEALIVADLGAATAAAVVAELESAARRDRLDADQLRERLAEILARIAGAGADPPPTIDLRAKPAIILIVGVNGTGKTTTLGKLAWQLREHFGLRVLLGAADTFRAAASEQLEGWAKRSGTDIVTGEPGSDPGAVAFETIARARADGYDVALIDTAGRLHNQEPLMAELEKVRRVIARQVEGAPHETLLVIDASTGQNGLRQAELFSAAAAVDGIVLTKLDGSARGGVAIAIARELGLPVKLIGIGEDLEDLRPFDPADFARALVGVQ